MVVCLEVSNPATMRTNGIQILGSLPQVIGISPPYNRRNIEPIHNPPSARIPCIYYLISLVVKMGEVLVRDSVKEDEWGEDEPRALV